MHVHALLLWKVCHVVCYVLPMTMLTRTFLWRQTNRGAHVSATRKQVSTWCGNSGLGAMVLLVHQLVDTRQVLSLAGSSVCSHLLWAFEQHTTCTNFI